MQMLPCKLNALMVMRCVSFGVERGCEHSELRHLPVEPMINTVYAIWNSSVHLTTVLMSDTDTYIYTHSRHEDAASTLNFPRTQLSSSYLGVPRWSYGLTVCAPVKSWKGFFFVSEAHPLWLAKSMRSAQAQKNISFILCMMDLSSTFRLQSAEQSEQRGKQMSRKLDTHPGKDWWCAFWDVRLWELDELTQHFY